MTLYATIDMPEDTTLPPHCPDLQTLTKKLAAVLLHCIVGNTLLPEMPRILVTHFDPAPICGACAAPLLHTGKCSSINCKFGGVNQRKPNVKGAPGRMIPARLLAVPGLKVAAQRSSE